MHWTIWVYTIILIKLVKVVFSNCFHYVIFIVYY